MFKLIKRLWAAAPVATAVLLIATLFAAGFSVRLALHAWFWRTHPPREETIAPWMTPGYVAHRWHMPREEMIEAMDLPAAPSKKRMSLTEIADEMGIPEEALMQRVQTAIDAHAPAPPPPREPEGRETRDE